MTFRDERDDAAAEFFKVTSQRPPSAMITGALAMLKEPTQVLELGCGAGVDTVAILKAGHRVHAVDLNDTAIALTRERAAEAGVSEPLQLKHTPFEALTLEAQTYGLIFARFALPFCPPSAFPALWKQLTDALAPGGLMVFQLFGDRDEWAASRAVGNTTHHSAEEVRSLLRPLNTISLSEEEGVKPMACGGDKYWHVFHVSAQAHTQNSA